MKTDIQKIRKCSYLLPDPGGEVVRELCDEVERLRAALADIKAYAEGHHTDEPGHVHFHSLTIDIPAFCDEALEPGGRR